MNPAGTACVPTVLSGGSCNETEDICEDSVPDLACRDGLCQCKDPETQAGTRWVPTCYGENFCGQFSYYFYDPNIAKKKCVAKLGLDFDKDRLSLTCPFNASLVRISSEERHKYAYNVDYTCECDANFTMQPDRRTCVQAKYKGEQCESEAQDHRCDLKANLVCLNITGNGKTGICGCRDGQLWNEVKGMCSIKAEQRCGIQKYDECVLGATCQINGRYGSDGTCKCERGYTSENGLCLKNHGVGCEGKGECKPPFACVDGVCSCPYPSFQDYNSELDICRNHVGISCADFGAFPCSENAECEDEFCRCKPGFKDDLKGSCIHAKRHGENCSTSECDAQQGLACFEGVCACVLPALSFETGKGCIATDGWSCGILKPFGECEGTSKRCEYFVRCGDSAQCKPYCEGAACFEQNSDLPYRCAIKQV